MDYGRVYWGYCKYVGRVLWGSYKQNGDFFLGFINVNIHIL